MNGEKSQTSEILISLLCCCSLLCKWKDSDSILIRGVWYHATVKSQLVKPHYFRPLQESGGLPEKAIGCVSTWCGTLAQEQHSPGAGRTQSQP